MTAITPDGLAVLDDATLVRVLELRPLAPLRLSSEQLERTGAAIGELAGKLPDRQSLQLVTQADPLRTEDLVTELHAEAVDTRRRLEQDDLLDRGMALEALALTSADGIVEHAARLAGTELRHLLVIPWRPARATLRSRVIASAALSRAIDEHEAHVSSIAGHLQSLELAPVLLDGFELAEVLYRQVNPGADEWTADVTELLAEPTADIEVAAARADELRQLFCQSQVDDRPRTHLIVGGSAIHCRAVSSVPDHTWLGWLLYLMQSPYPFTLAVHWRAGRRATERQRAKQRYRRIWGVQRAREIRLRPPDPEANEREREAAQLTAELAASAGAGVYEVAIVLTLRHPDGNYNVLSRHARDLERELLSRTDARLHHPIFAQLEAWRSTRPRRGRPAADPPQVPQHKPRGHDPVDCRSVWQPRSVDPARLGETGRA